MDADLVDADLDTLCIAVYLLTYFRHRIATTIRSAVGNRPHVNRGRNQSRQHCSAAKRGS